MAITIGMQLGSHEITALLGRGGMGEVYRARDTRLKREVAIKLLPDEFARDPDRVTRFEREAELLASLNHANIAAIYDVQEAQDSRFLVLELVEGETLAERLKRGPIPLDEALPLAKQIAEALEAAHEKGIMHRDLKPANIKWTPEGRIKVLDFGLAKALNEGARSPLTSNSPTLSLAATQAGIILGTAGYMSPEQAKGKEVDRRADIWAFGVVLFEMLTGRTLFSGETASETMAAVMMKEPEWNALPAGTSSRVRDLLRRCLVKDPRSRLRDIGDARLAIEEIIAHPEADAPRSDLTEQPSFSPAPRRWRFVLLGTAVGAVLAAFFTWIAFRPAAAPIVRLTAKPLDSAMLGSLDPDIAISPDGRHIVYVTGDSPATLQLYVRTLDQLDAKALPGITGVRTPFVSPDGNWIGFFDGTALKKVAINGGPAVTICGVDAGPRGATWGADDRIVFATGNASTGLQRVAAGGGITEVLTRPDAKKGEGDHLFPEILPGGRAVLFTITPQTGPIENSQIAVLNLVTKEQKVLIQGGSNPRYSASGHIVYAVAGTLRAVAFDTNRLELRGDPVPVADHVVTKASGAADFSIAGNGSLTYVDGDVGSGVVNTLVWVDRQGHEEPIVVPPRAYNYPRISPDGTRVALDIRDQENDIWIWDFMRRTLTRLTFDPGFNRNIAWTPDGRRLAFSAQREGSEHVYWQAADGTGIAERLTNGANGGIPNSFSPDGKRLLFITPAASPPRDVGIITLEGEHHQELLLHTPFDEESANFSPDGRWLAYDSNESGKYEIYVRPFPDINSGRWQISVGGGTRPVWARNGRELFYFVPPGTVMSAPIQPGSTFSAGSPQMVFQGQYPPPNAGITYDVSPDGRRFLMIKQAQSVGASTAPPQLVVVLNWFQELTRLTRK